MNRRRFSYGGFGNEIRAISEEHILAYSKLHGIVFKSAEVDLITDLDDIYLKDITDGLGKPSNKDK